MTNRRRLVAVVVALAVMAVVTSSQLWGDPAAPADRNFKLPKDDKRPALPPADAEAALARSKFETNAVLTYRPAEGQPIFALQVQPKLDPLPRRPRDLVLLVSTTATVAGASFNSAKQLAEAFAEQADPRDRIALWTVNSPKSTKNLTGDFVAPKDKKLKNAFKTLAETEFPAGAADLKHALEQALASFTIEGRQRVVLYLGDGLSLHNPLAAAEREALGRQLADKHAGFFPVPLGNRLDSANLHGLANGSGGAVLRVRIFEEKVADALARAEKALAAPILYPTRFQLEGVLERFPTALPPLRTDTPTLVLGRYNGLKELTWSAEGTVDGRVGVVKVTQTLPVPAAEDDNFFLVSMAEQWKRAPAQHALIRADRALVFAFEANRLREQELVGNGAVAVREGQLDVAARLFEQARALAPHNAEAKAGLKLVANLRSGKLTRAQLEEHLRRGDANKARLERGAVRKLGKDELIQLAQLGEDAKGPKDGGAAGSVPALNRDDLFQAQRDRVIVEEQKTRQGVEAALRQARRDLPVDPEAAHELLRTVLLQVRDNFGIGERARQDLGSQLQAALRDVAVRGRAIRDRLAEEQKVVAAAKKELDAGSQRAADQERTEARFRVYKGLMNLARYEERAMREITEGMVAMQREAKVRGDGVPLATQAMYDQAQVRFNLQKAQDLKRLREQRFLEVMMSIEKSHVPFADEPPIHFPALDFWKAIYDLRKEKYQVSSLPDDPKGRAEATAIAKLLEAEMDMKDFQQPMKLREVLQMFSDKMLKANDGKELGILIDTEAFKTDNPDAPDVYEIDVKFPPLPRKMSLATALRVALSQIPTRDATYIIRRNYIEVTTNDRVVEEKVLRVYPVGMLAMPINPMGGMMMGGMMGMKGGMMGMGGGMMGMMGMGGGGMMGMMGMGGGGMMGMMGMGGMGGMQMMGMGGMQMMGMGGMGGGMMGMMGMGGMGGMGGMQMMGMGGMQMMGMGGMGGMQMMGMGGMQMMGMGGMGGMQMMGMGGGMMGMMGMGGGMMGMMGMGGGMMGMMGMGGMMGGQMMGGFNGNLGMQGATQAQPLITLVTQVVAPGEWFITPAQQAAMNFQGNFMGMGFMGMGGGFMGMGMGFMGMNFMGMNFMGNFQGPPPPVQQGGPANLQKSNTIQFFPSSLALIIRGSSRIHYKIGGGQIGSKVKMIEGAAAAGPDKVLAKNGPPRGGVAGVAGAVDDDPRQGPKQVAKAPDPVKVRDPKKVVDPKAGGTEVVEVDPKKVWEEALKLSGADPGLIIATADFLFENEKYEHAAEFLKANLRLGLVVRPWVYEALAVALEASGGPPEEVRRARLSAVALDPQDAGGFLRAAQAMAENKEYSRALAFCRQAALLEPNASRPYEDALVYAELSEDSTGLQWAAEKLLSQDWPEDDGTLHLKAQAKLDAMAGALNRGARKAEADKLRQTLKKLGERDLVVRLSWEPGVSGPADLELEVKEPSGGICSSQQRQTPGGGILLGNNLSELTRASYVAAQAFSGEYQVTVRRLWGLPLGSKATLTVIQHQGTPQEQRRIQTIHVDQTVSLKVNLQDGRRKELASLAPPAQELKQKENPAQTARVLTKLRDIADADFSGGPQAVMGGMGTSQAARTAAYAPVLSRQSEKLSYQTTLSSVSGGIGLTARASLSADLRTLQLSVQPNFLGMAGSAASRPSVQVPLIPGAANP